MTAGALGWSGPAAHTIAELLGRCTFPVVGTPVTCAVSGGADSTALAVLAVASGCAVTIAHVDHGLRPTSAADAAAVAQLAAQLGVPYTLHTVHVGAGPNLEARARAARYGALPTEVLTGHTADDQAETMLINLLRGAATSGLAAMRPGPQRPLLNLRRADTEALCALAGLAVVHDETNADSRFVRNRVRHEVLPLLIDVAQRDLAPVLARQAAHLRADDDLLQQLAATIDVTDAPALAAAPLPLARRAVRAWLAAHEPEAHPPDSAAVDRVLDVAAGRSLACEVAGIGRVERHRQQLSISSFPDAFA